TRVFTQPFHVGRDHSTFSPNRRYVAGLSRENDQVVLVDLVSEKIVGELPFGPKTPARGAIRGLAFSPDGKLLTLHHLSGTRRLMTWNLETGALVANV